MGFALYPLRPLRFKIDDPVQAFPVHGACGAWGVFACALFDWGVPRGKSARRPGG